MGTTFVTVTHDASGNEPGFWMSDRMLELWLRLLALHLPDSTNSDVANEIRNKWLLASRGCFGGCVPHGINDICATQEGRAVVHSAVDSLLTALRQTATPLDVDTMNLLGIQGLFSAPVEREWLEEIGYAFLDLLAGKITGTAASTEVMPGSKPYKRR